MTYSIVDFPEDNMNYGNFKADKPKNAANKAFDYLSKISNLQSKFGVYIVFTIIDNDTKKEYDYIGSRVKLENPITDYHNGEKVKYYYKNVIGRYLNELNKINSNLNSK